MAKGCLARHLDREQSVVGVRTMSDEEEAELDEGRLMDAGRDWALPFTRGRGG